MRCSTPFRPVLVLLPDDPIYTIAAVNRPAPSRHLRRISGEVCLTLSSRSQSARVPSPVIATKAADNFEEDGPKSCSWTKLADPEPGWWRQFILHHLGKSASSAQPSPSSCRCGSRHTRRTHSRSQQSLSGDARYSRDELVLRDSAHFTHPDDLAVTRQFYASFQQEPRDTATIEKRYIRKDGRLLWRAPP